MKYELIFETGVIYIPDEPVVTEVFREKTIEDIIEEQRAKLAAEGKVGTPVTAETFARWRAGKLAQKQVRSNSLETGDCWRFIGNYSLRITIKL